MLLAGNNLVFQFTLGVSSSPCGCSSSNNGFPTIPSPSYSPISSSQNPNSFAIGKKRRISQLGTASPPHSAPSVLVLSRLAPLRRRHLRGGRALPWRSLGQQPPTEERVAGGAAPDGCHGMQPWNFEGHQAVEVRGVQHLVVSPRDRGWLVVASPKGMTNKPWSHGNS